MIQSILRTGFCLLTISGFLVFGQSEKASEEIKPSSRASYWSYKGQEIMLLGGSSEDNLFQTDNVVEELDLLKSVGGNYVRCTMSSRDEGNLWPFEQDADGLYDLSKMNDEYWECFEAFLNASHERDIIVQIEIWATFDFYREYWKLNPFNPKNNRSYTKELSQLPLVVDSHPVNTDNNFFRSVPSQLSLAPVLQAQQNFVDKLLSISLKYGNVLYCMDNETSVSSEWGKYWASYILEKAGDAGIEVHTTEMWDPWELSHPFHAETYNNPDYFTFMDISQNNHQTGDKHWENGIGMIRMIHGKGIRPINNIKVYGNDGGRHKTTRNGVENYIQNVLMGCASTRFHRPTSGQGLNENAQAVIRSMRWLVNETNYFEAKPMNELFIERVENQHYCRAIPGKEYVVAFMQNTSCKLSVENYSGLYAIKWLNILENKWCCMESEIYKKEISLEPPGDGYWLGFVIRE